MKNSSKDIAALLAIAFLLLATGCGSSEPDSQPEVRPEQSDTVLAATLTGSSYQPEPEIPNLQAELLDERNKTSSSPLAQIDFKNFSYKLPRGWQNPDNSDLTLGNGRLDPIAVHIDQDMPDEEKIERRARRRIGASYVTTKFMDVTGDGDDEAFVILKIETTGSAIPQLVYVYTWKDEKPEPIWYFRTGDRADGGLKDIRLDNGNLTIELYGQDRFLLGETETGKVTGDEEQLCCPTFFTKTNYKWNGKHFLLQGKRLTYSVEDPAAAPIENLGEIVQKQLQMSGKK